MSELTVATVLIAEDDPDDLFLLRRALHQLRPGLSTAAARDGIELFEYLHDRPTATLPALLIIDLNMPRMDGREVLRKLHADRRLTHIPVVVVTTSVEPEDFNFAAALHASAVLSKPEAFTTLLALLREPLDIYLGTTRQGAR